jgi:hypothetical protein
VEPPTWHDLPISYESFLFPSTLSQAKDFHWFSGCLGNFLGLYHMPPHICDSILESVPMSHGGDWSPSAAGLAAAEPQVEAEALVLGSRSRPS